MVSYLARFALILFVLACVVVSFAGQATAQADQAVHMRALADAAAAADAGDFGRAAHLLEPFAIQGDPVFMNMLGDLYARGGKDLPKDQAKAFTLYSRAAAKGNATSQRLVAVAYERGQGVQADPTLAKDWYLKAASKGDALAQFIVGKRRASGEGLTQDYVQAWKWLTLATTGAATGDEKAMREEAAALRMSIAAKMSPLQLSDAQRLVREWTPR
jgi:TPR repeat protein